MLPIALIDAQAYYFVEYICGLKTGIPGGSAKIGRCEIVASEAIRQQRMCFQKFPDQRRAAELRAILAALASRIEKSPHLNSRF
jgi:hypothetical protein